jgi:UDP-N-acetylmuramyl pentapeptide phosphotransferase/UDP-N-acetylglucosamine-1-phosphate transferase
MFLDAVNLTYYFSLISISFFLCNYLLKNNKFIDKDIKKKQAIHNLSIPRSGGLLLFFGITAAIFYNYTYFEENYFRFLPIIITIFIVGFIDDYGIKLNPLIRFLILFFSCFLFLILINFKLRTTGLSIIDMLIFKYNLEFLIISICLLILINGSNFIDGINGNLTLHFFILLFLLLYISFDQSYALKNLIISSIVSLIPFLLFNFKNKIFLGDGGAYLAGLILGLIIVEIMYLKTDISPFFFLILTYYLGAEVLISFFRRLLNRKSVVIADFNHLHSLLYSLLKKKIKLNAHFASSFLINLFFFFSVFPSIYFINNFEFTRIYLIILYFSYILIYIFLRYLSKKILN